MNSPVIELKGVSKRFGDLIAVNELSLTIHQGEIFGLLGPNGAGKTTTIQLIVGLLRRHAGEIYVLGLDPEQDPRKIHRRIGLVPQETNVYLDLNAVDNLYHHAALYCENLQHVPKRIEDLLQLVNLWQRRLDPLRTYSGGMKRRLALARALLHDPEIIFFDEPTLGVDVQGRHAIWEHIHQQAESGKTFLISTNDMAEAEALCGRLVIIDAGSAIAQDTPGNLKSALGRDIITLQTDPAIMAPLELLEGLNVHACSSLEEGQLRLEVPDAAAMMGEIVQRVSARYRLESIRMAHPTLDDVFLHHTGRALRE